MWNGDIPTDQDILSNDDIFGFVYRIERLNAVDGEKKFYWGCKQFKKNIKRLPKGKRRKVTRTVMSDWKTYWGSSKMLLDDISKYGENNFERTIIKICSCKWQLKYDELLVQLENNVLARTDTYNGIINVRLGNCPRSLLKEYSQTG